MSFVRWNTNSFVCFSTDSSEVDAFIKSIKNKKCNTDTIPNFIYKCISNIISFVLSRLINLSLETWIFPKILKKARVVALFKSGDRRLLSNYRPISTLHFLSKIFEKCMYKRLLAFLNKYAILSPMQFGFRKDNSTIDAILRYTDQIFDVFKNSVW